MRRLRVVLLLVAVGLAPSAPAYEVDVGGEPGWYVGRPHEIVYLDPGGVRRSASARLAGPTLIWVRGATTYRLEADLPADRLAAIVATV